MRIGWAQGTGFSFQETNEPKKTSNYKTAATLPAWEEWNDPDYWREKAEKKHVESQIKTSKDFVQYLKSRIQ